MKRLVAGLLAAIGAIVLIADAILASLPNHTTAPLERAEPSLVRPVVTSPDKVLGYESCAKCHEQEIVSWKRTPHFTTFDRLHRTPEAKQIAKRLGFRSVKRNDTCIQCHYTHQSKGDRTRAISGVSCESCHGAATDWITIHNDYGSPTATKETETAANRIHRLQTSISLGMNNPANVYLIARQCLSCHTVPSEELVNTGGHIAGSVDFELVSWSQGSVRHNFLRTGGHTNAPSDPNRQRLMYVVGLLTDLEMSLRATAKATVKARYGISVAQRAARLKKQLWQVHQAVQHPLLGEALDAALTAPLRLHQAEALLAAADRIGAAAYQLAAQVDGSELTAVDGWIIPAGQFK